MTKKYLSVGLISILITGCEPVLIELELEQETKDYASDMFGSETDDEQSDESTDTTKDPSENHDFYPVEREEDVSEGEESIENNEGSEESSSDVEEIEETERIDEENTYAEDNCGDEFAEPIERRALWIQTDYAQHSSPLNTGTYGSSEAAEILTTQNIDWELVRMDEVTFHPEYLMNYDIIILYGHGHLGPLSDTDAAVLEYWVLQGGGLMYHTFHPTEATCNMLNSLPSSFGIQCVPESGTINGSGSPTVPHPINNDIQEIVVLGGEKWNVQQPAQSIVEDASGNTLIATVEWGYGRFVGINDEWPLYNSGTGQADISVGDNYLMLDNAFCWLVGDCNEAQPLGTGFECNTSVNFMLDIEYSQISLTDGCYHLEDEILCDTNPVYHETPDLELAADYCQDICNEDEECTGYFFQKHQNGHEICGFYSEPIDLTEGIWHGHQEGSRVCKKN